MSTNAPSLAAQIRVLLKKKNAVLLAHYYQDKTIQVCADYLGDSLFFAQKAQATTADIIVLAGVHFMAETAKILNPQKKSAVAKCRGTMTTEASGNITPENLLSYAKTGVDYISMGALTYAAPTIDLSLKIH